MEHWPVRSYKNWDIHTYVHTYTRTFSLFNVEESYLMCHEIIQIFNLKWCAFKLVILIIFLWEEYLVSLDRVFLYLILIPFPKYQGCLPFTKQHPFIKKIYEVVKKNSKYYLQIKSTLNQPNDQYG